MSEERPDALLKSALEKIVYFEARSEQLTRDAENARAEAERLKRELADAAQREIALRRNVAALEVELARSHRERDEIGRVADALRAERTQQVEKILDAARIGASDHAPDDDSGFDLAAFIAQLRSEVLAHSSRPAPAPAPARPEPVASAAPPPMPAPEPDSIERQAERLHAEGRLQVSSADVARLVGVTAFGTRSDETIFGFSIRELSSPDSAARRRAAERLLALKQTAAAPALATALHAERDPEVLVALLHAFAEVASTEGAAVVRPLLDAKAPDVRIAALKALLALDPTQAAPHLSAAMRDPDRAVRRRASLMALSLAGDGALGLGEQAVRDSDADVRSLGALVLGASAGDRARTLLLSALRDPEKKVRMAAAQSLSRLLGQDVSPVVDLDDAQRRREVRRLGTLPIRPVLGIASPQAPAKSTSAAQTAPAAARVAVATLDAPAPVAQNPGMTAAPRTVSESLCSAIAVELRSALRGRTVSELAAVTREPPTVVTEACALLSARGQAVRRGAKFFAA